MKTRVPFTGFYNSVHEDAFDTALECELENFPERAREDYSFDREWYAKKYVEEYVNTFPVRIRLEFCSLHSPKEYNFETDAIYADISLEDVQVVREYAGGYNLNSCIERECTHRSGFISFYPATLREWDLKPMSEWEPAQIELLLGCVLGDECEIYVDASEFLIYKEDQIHLSGGVCSGPCQIHRGCGRIH